MLLGRDFDLAHVREVVVSAAGGRGGALALVGQAGVGKTALLDHVAAEHGQATRLVRVTGLESEAELGWGGLDALVGPFADEPALAALAPARALALRSALLLEGAAGAPGVRAVALATLDLLTAQASAARPLLVLVDDLHWLDGESRQVVEFVARRIADDYVAIVATSRTPTALPTRTLLELDRDATERLLRVLGARSATVRRRLVEALGTNPMLLTETVRSLDPATLDGRASLPDPLPLPHTLAEQAHRRLAPLDAAGRRALLVLAALANSDLAIAAEALGRAGHSLGDLAGAEGAGIVVLDVAHGRIAFAHPTLRTAVYGAASPPDRRAAHLLLADVSSLPPAARATHRAVGTVGADEAAAAAVEEAAMENWHRGAVHSAGDELARAAALSEDEGSRARRLVRAAEASLQVGALGRADALLDDVVELGSAADPVELSLVTARSQHLQQHDDHAVDLLRSTAASVVARDPGGAARLRLEVLGPLVRLLRVGDVAAELAELGELGRRAARPGVDASTRLRIEAAASAFAAISAPDAAAPALVAATSLVDVDGVAAAGPFLCEVVAPMLSYGVRRPEVLAFLDGLESQLRDAGAFVPLVSLLGARQYQLVGRDNPLAVSAGLEAMDLADEVGLAHLGSLAAQGVAVAAAVLGDATAHARAVDVMSRRPSGAGAVQSLSSTGLLHLGAGRLDEALAAYERLLAEHGMGTYVLRWEPDYLEVLVRLRRAEDAAATLAELDAAGHTSAGAFRFDRARAMVESDDERALALFASAAAGMYEVGELGNAGRTELCRGERLRRMRRRAEARRHLQRAIDVLTPVGAGPWVARAEAELASAGGRPSSHEDRPVHELLSPQELRVARMVAAGASNRELAAALFVSARTVESHLSAIFRKLGVRNRRELAARAVVDPLLRAGSDAADPVPSV